MEQCSALQKSCIVGEKKYICIAEDTHKGWFLSIRERCLLETHYHETFRLLRDFDGKMFLAAHDAKLLLEDARLEDLDQKMFLVKYKGSVDYKIYIYKVTVVQAR